MVDQTWPGLGYLRCTSFGRFAAAVCFLVLLLGCAVPGGEGSSRGSLGTETSNQEVGRPVKVETTTTKAGTESNSSLSEPTVPSDEQSTRLGAAVLERQGFESLAGKRVGLIANQASVLEGQHLVDLFAESENVDLVAIFAPEHGWRGSEGAGVEVAQEVDPKTGLPVFSLYGSNREPTKDMLAEIDLLVFDLQDVGTRYYTYISTMGLAMQAAAENNVEFMVLDRPNPRGGLLSAGPVRSPDQESFVSQYPIPTLYGMTAGELARAIVGEQWLSGLDDLSLSVVEMENWNRAMTWSDTGLDWIPPSPGLPTIESALIYPATVQFEATTLSYGRGTEQPFSQVGAPWIDGPALANELNGRNLDGVNFVATRFTPGTDPVAVDPQYDGIEISGVKIEITDVGRFEPVGIGVHLLDAVLAQAAEAGEEPLDRSQMFDLLAGQSTLRAGLQSGTVPEDIVAAWQSDLDAFDRISQKYQIYE